MKPYDPKKIEKKWQKEWEKRKLYEVKESPKKKKFYSLIEFPYPSGAGLHVGHIRSNTAMDVISRKRRAEGYNVLYPIGWDAFGLPTENYAIKTGTPPAKVTKQNTDTFRRQLKSLGFSFDWSREVNTTDPAYYKWTQWIFLQMYEKGLAYKAKMTINWCPKDKIGLANEEVVDGCCERCGTPVEKREKEQWMLAITKYADRLDRDLDLVDYLEKIKIQQRNWIGRSEGAELTFNVPNSAFKGEQKPPKGYFKFRPHLARQILRGEKWVTFRMEPKDLKVGDVFDVIDWADGKVGNQKKVALARITKTLSKPLKELLLEYPGHETEDSTEETRLARYRQYYGDGVTNDSLVHVYEFEVDHYEIDVFTTRPDTLFGATYVVLSPEHALVDGLKPRIKNRDAVEKYRAEARAKTDIERTSEGKEKTGVELKGVKAVNPANGEEVPVWIADYVLAHYGTGAIMAVPAHDERDHAFAKKFRLPIVEVILGGSVGAQAHTGGGTLVNSGEFNGMDSEKAKKAITEKVGGALKTTYKLHDWVFSRQRYWGEPIPMVYCEKCGWQPVPEKELPVKLPSVKNYQPTDTVESPLAAIDKWVKTRCPSCKGPARRETDTMPNWAGSSWYFLRYTDPKNAKAFASRNKLDYWMPVDWYNGGMEHTTLHLLYSRFWHKFLYDIGCVGEPEPFKKRTSHGMVLAEGGEKMSKSKGNVINPDEIVEHLGADTLRVYEMFMGPFDQAIPWSTDNMVGARRFIEKVWRLREKADKTADDEHLERETHRTIKKVSEDIESMNFNTAISAMMILSNEFEKATKVPTMHYEALVRLLAPFAPHVAEELWESLGHVNSIHLESWQAYDAGKLENDTVWIVFQVNGKVRAELEVSAAATEDDVKKAVKSLPEAAKWLEGKDVKRVVYVKGRLVNYVVT